MCRRDASDSPGSVCKLNLQSGPWIAITGMYLISDSSSYYKISKLFQGLSTSVYSVLKLTGPDNPLCVPHKDV